VTGQHLAIVYQPIAALNEYPTNPRTHSDAQIKQIVDSILQFGWTNPILIDENNMIIAGHGRYFAALAMEMKQVPTITLSSLSDAQKRAYVIADNQLALASGWDKDLLARELFDLKSEDFNIDVLGFGEFELNSFISRIDRSGADEDDVPAAPAVAVTKPGDIWLMGDHRLICGDSTDAKTVFDVLHGALPGLMVTDPPYGVEYDANWRNESERRDGKPIGARAIGKVENDDRADWTKAYELFPGQIAYVWHASLRGVEVFHNLESAGFEIRNQIIWAKNNFAIGRGDYHWQHEPCWYGVRGNGRWTGDRSQTTVWNIDKPLKSETGHSTQKPVECMRRPIENHTLAGEVVYDPFLGSGTSIIAAESIDRICYGCELSPAYCDVIVKRWMSVTGGVAYLEKTREPFPSETVIV
jgi:DNA modification methylase